MILITVFISSFLFTEAGGIKMEDKSAGMN